MLGDGVTRSSASALIPMAERSSPVEPALVRTSRTPQRDRGTLIEHPPQRQGQHRFAKAFPRELFELSDRGEILVEACALEFRIDIAQVVALELGLRRHSSAEQTAA